MRLLLGVQCGGVVGLFGVLALVTLSGVVGRSSCSDLRFRRTTSRSQDGGQGGGQQRHACAAANGW